MFWERSQSSKYNRVRKNRSLRSRLLRFEQFESRLPMAFDLLDTGFGTNGITRVDSTFLTGTIDYAGTSIVAPDGKVIVAGSSDGASTNTFVSRYNANGTIDTGFGVNGFITLPELGSVELALSSTGELLVLGAYFYDETSGETTSRLYRFGASGVPITTFGSQGFVSLASATAGELYYHLELSTSGSIYVVGSEGFGNTAKLYARKLTPAGAPDASFGPAGKRLLAVPGFGVTPTDSELDSLERLVIVGFANSNAGVRTAVLRVNSNGTFDNTFDSDGRRVLDIGASGNFFQPMKLASAADGTMFIAATGVASSSSTPTSTAYVAKLASSGQLVTAFGGTGIITLPTVGGIAIASASSIIVDPNLGIALAVETEQGTIRGGGLVRLNATTGALESSFGNSGLALIPFFGSSLGFPNSLSLAFGELTVSGTVGKNSGVNIGVAQVDGPSGGFDFSFGTRGRLSIDYSTLAVPSPASDKTWSIDTVSNGSVFVVGSTRSPYSFEGPVGLVTKLRTTGGIDTTFGLQGRVMLESLREAKDVVAVSDGSVYVVGAFLRGSPFDPQADRDFALVKLRSDGDIDTTFGVGGYSLIDFGGQDTPTSLIAGGSGKWIIAGSTTNSVDGSRIAVARLNANGSLDTSFDGDGRAVVTTSPTTSEFASDVKRDPSGRIVVAGSAGVGNGFDPLINSSFIAVRFLDSGAIDTSFNGSGVLTRSLGVANESYVASSLEILGDSSLIIGGTVIRNAATDSDFLLMAFSSSGAVRTAFGTTGAVRTDFPRNGGSADILASTIRSGNQIVAAGASVYNNGISTRSDAILTAYNASTGALDATFAPATNSRLRIPLPTSSGNGAVGLDVVGGLLYVGGDFLSATNSSDMFVARYGRSAPSINGATNANYTENAPPVRMLTVATISDLDAKSYGGSSIQVDFTSAPQLGDLLDVTAVGQVSLSTYNIRYQGIVVGTWSRPTTSSLQVLFNAQSTITSVTAILRSIAFSTSSDDPSTIPRVVRFTVVDSTGLSSAPALSTVTITPVNDVPVITGVQSTLTYSLNTTAVLVANNAIVGDIDHTNFSGGQLSLRFIAGAVAANRLTLSGSVTVNAANEVSVSGVVIGTLNSSGGVGLAPLTITFSSNATTARVQALLRAIRFSTLSGVAGARTLEIELTDPAFATWRVTQSIMVT